MRSLLEIMRFLLGKCFLPLLIVLGSMASQHACGDESPNQFIKSKKLKRLTTVEDAMIREMVYTMGLGIGPVPSDPSGTQRGLVVPIPVFELHKSKRLATLNLLLDIVKGGRPDDALTAAGYAVALEEHPIAGILYMFYSADAVDKVQPKDERSGRDKLIERLTKLLRRIEKEDGAGVRNYEERQIKNAGRCKLSS